MPEIIVKGADTSDAMDKVQKLLGPDALILNTRKNGSYIEITATDEPVAARPRATNKNAIFSKMLQANLDAQKTEVQAREANSEKMMTARDLKKSRGIDLEPIEEAPKPQLRPVIKTTMIDEAQSQAVLSARQIVLVGSQGAGKSLIALQIATEGMRQNASFRPRLIFVGNGSRADAAYLRDKANLIGVPLLYRRFDELAHMSDGADQDIIVISGSVSTKLEDIQSLNPENLILVLPSSLGTSAAKKRLSMMEGLVSGVILSHCEEDAPEAGLIATIDKANVLLVRKSHGHSMMNNLFAITHEDLSAWNPSFAPEPKVEIPEPAQQADSTTSTSTSLPSLFRKRWSDAKPETKTSSIVVPMLTPKKKDGSHDPRNHEGHL